MERRRTIETDALSSSSPARVSLTDQVYERVREEIIKARWRPGQILLEPELAVLCGVSKTPVREALRLLVQEEWIVILPRKGYLVRPLRLEDISEVFSLRMMIEPALFADAARLAAPEMVQELRRWLIAQQEAEGDLAGSLDAAREFHLAAAKLGHNRRAEGILERLIAEVRRLHHLMPDVESHINSSVEIEAHAAILDAVARRDAEGAAEIMRNHLAEVARTMIEGFGAVRID